jgi:hypothetical protein
MNEERMQGIAGKLREAAQALDAVALMIESGIADGAQPKLFEGSGQETGADDGKIASGQEQKELAFTDVRSFLASRSSEGYRSEVKALVMKYGDSSGKLSSVKKECYAALMKEALFACRPKYTLEEIREAVAGLGDKAPAILEHNCASSADDLKEEHYAAFMRDASEADHAGN